MNESRINELVEELNRIISEENASIAFRQYGGAPDECAIVGNRNGLLRTGVELLKAGVSSPVENIDIRDLSALRRITHAKSNYFFDYFEEQDLSEVRMSGTKDARATMVICFVLLAVGFIMIGFALYGAFHLFT